MTFSKKKLLKGMSFSYVICTFAPTLAPPSYHLGNFYFGN